MKTLLLRLKGPLQAWGVGSRYQTRSTEHEPTKSGIVGLLAAAQGRRRTESIEDLAALSFAVRTDQPGTLVRDYQTARNWNSSDKNSKLSTRYYLSDAVFVAGIHGPAPLITDLAAHIKQPKFALYLGRRACPVNPDLLIDVADAALLEALHAVPWQAATWHRKTRARLVHLPLRRDTAAGEAGDMQQDVPVSFNPEHRQHGWRSVISEHQQIANPLGKENIDPFFEAVASS